MFIPRHHWLPQWRLVESSRLYLRNLNLYSNGSKLQERTGQLNQDDTKLGSLNSIKETNQNPLKDSKQPCFKNTNANEFTKSNSIENDSNMTNFNKNVAYFQNSNLEGATKRHLDFFSHTIQFDNSWRSFKKISKSFKLMEVLPTTRNSSRLMTAHFSTRSRQLYMNRNRSILGKLESEANQDPSDANKQARFYNELMKNNYHEMMINRFETYQLAANQECLQTYIAALVATQQTEKLAGKVLQAIRSKPDLRAIFENSDGETIINNLLGSSHAASVATGSSAAPGASGKKGDKFYPIHVVVEQPKGAAFWKTLKSFGLTLTYIFCILTFLSLALDNSGLVKPPSPSPEYEAETTNSVKFDDVQGVDEAKQELVELVEFLKDPAKFTSLGGKLPKGVLLTGPPGTGKTLLARAVAGQAGVPFFFMSGSEFDEMYVGVGARRVRELFAAARRKAPSIVFIDELDAIGARRNPKDQSYMKQTLNQLLVDLDGFSQTEGVIFIAATNFPELLDKALTRPGRFDRHVHVPNPDVRGRLQILKLHSSKIELDKDVDLERVARGTIGFSGADLANLVNLAAIEAAKSSSSNVKTNHFEFAKDRIIMGAERRSAVITEESKRMTAYHEGGHALVAYFTDGAMPLHKATVIPRGQSLGMVVQLPEMDKNSFSKKEYRARLDVCMGGRVAEEMIYGNENISSGAQSDLQQATDIARGMIISFGMSEKVGPVEYSQHINTLSQQTKQLIEDETKRMLIESYDRAKQILKDKRPELERLAKALIEKETLNFEEIEKAIKNK